MFYPESTCPQNNYSLNQHASMRLQRPVKVNMYRGSVDKQSIWTPTHSPKARHFLFTVASGKEEAPWKKNMKKKNLKTTTGSLRGQVDKACVGGQLRMCRYPVCFGVHFCVKFQYLGGKLPSRRDPVMILKTDVKILCVTVRVNSLVIRSAFKKKEKRKS